MIPVPIEVRVWLPNRPYGTWAMRSGTCTRSEPAWPSWFTSASGRIRKVVICLFFGPAKGHFYHKTEKMPGKDVRCVSDMALLTHIKAIHAEIRGANGWPRIWRELRH